LSLSMESSMHTQAESAGVLNMAESISVPHSVSQSACVIIILILVAIETYC